MIQAARLSHHDILSRLRACEEGDEGAALLADPAVAAVYPLARQRVVAANLAAVTTSGLGTGNGRKARLRGLLNILRHEGIRPARLPRGPVDLAMLSFSTSRLFKLPDGWPEAYAEPFLTAVEATGGRGVLLEIPALGEYRDPPIRKGHLLGLDELRARLVARLRPRPAPADAAIARFVALWQQAGLDPAGLDGAGWSRTWNHFDRRRGIFARQMDRLRPEVAIVVTWYGTTGMAFTAAAQERGIPVADLQHGVQGPGHCMYGHWPASTLKSPLIPRAFLTWSKAEADHLPSWMGPARRAYVCGQPWLHMDQALLATSPDFRDLRQAAGDRPVVLVSLQPNAGPLLDYVHSALDQPGADRFAWALRCHPGHLNQVDQISSRFAGRSEVLPVRQATLAPLSLVLGIAAAHVTEFSSVVLEAASAGVPSILTSDFGRSIYPHLAGNELTVALSPEDLLANLAQLGSGPRPGRQADATNGPQAALAAFRADRKAGFFDTSSRSGSDR